MITLLTENHNSEPPNQAELMAWAELYGQSFPTVSDGEGYIHTFGGKSEVSLPSHTLLGPGGLVMMADGEITEEAIVAALPWP